MTTPIGTDEHLEGIRRASLFRSNFDFLYAEATFMASSDYISEDELIDLVKSALDATVLGMSVSL